VAAHQLAQVNIALPLEPLDAPLLADFVAALEPVNTAADRAPGFVWRLQTEDLAVLRRRRAWFAPAAEAHLALWWVPAGRRPAVAEAEERLALLRRDGPTPAAFTLRRAYPPPGS
jgi:hypothetical protein